MIGRSDMKEILRSVPQMASSCLDDLGHTRQVTRLALSLFDELGILHRLGSTERLWLECAAMLHDIGWVQGAQGHHKKSLQMILESQNLPLDNKERLIIGSIARYHRKALPSDQHDHYAALESRERAAVDRLAALLRIADGLDYTHESNIIHLRCDIMTRKVIMWCTVNRPVKIEFDRALTKSDLFQQVFRKKVVLAEESQTEKFNGGSA